MTAPPEATATPPPASVAPTATAPPSETAAPAAPTASATAAASPTAGPARFNPDDYALRQIAEGLTEPVFLTHAGDARLFIVEQPGTIRILENGRVSPTPFLDIRERVNDGANEQGLLGLAFHPNYAENGYFFVNYTGAEDETIIARFSVTDDPNRADPASEKVILTIAQPYRNHNGGDLAFGPDGYLYIGMGDGGSAGDPENHAQNLGSLLGKMLRLDVDNGDPYTPPADNPFVTRADVAPEIWAYGLRNPWRFSFDRATGDLYIADVGQNAYEEVNFQPAGSAGENYGWRYFEGTHDFKDAANAPSDVVPPIAEYGRGDGCSVTGGYVYRGAALPELTGVYFFGDYCSGRIWSLRRDAAGAWVRESFGDADFTLSSFGEDAAGELYVLDHRGGGIYQIVRR